MAALSLHCVTGLCACKANSAKSERPPDQPWKEFVHERLANAATEAKCLDGAPEQYTEWATLRLDDRIGLAVENLGDSEDDYEALAAGEAKIPDLCAAIVSAAETSCTPDQCQSRHSEPPPVEVELHERICPGLFPFC
jgi:hypothetical protein